MDLKHRARVLCVDDDSNLLEGIARNLRGHFEVSTAKSGDEGLSELRKNTQYAVVVSDLKMPGMDGVDFLARVRQISPDAVRILLTGQADLDAAIAAVNEGRVFRLLCKPCRPEALIMAVEAAVEQHRLITAERELLEETLRGCVNALSEVLASVSPDAFGRAIRVRQLLSKLLKYLGVQDRWAIEVAAMLSQIGCVTLPAPVLKKIGHGETLTPAEQAMKDRVPIFLEQLLDSIPRLGPVRKILRYMNKNFDGTGVPRDGVAGESIPWGARALKAALDLDALEQQGLPTELALHTLRGRNGLYDNMIIDAIALTQGIQDNNSLPPKVP
jgi:response regulator RpfG family c-di-GMP phosphodiesterase